MKVVNLSSRHEGIDVPQQEPETLIRGLTFVVVCGTTRLVVLSTTALRISYM